MENSEVKEIVEVILPIELKDKSNAVASFNVVVNESIPISLIFGPFVKMLEFYVHNKN